MGSFERSLTEVTEVEKFIADVSQLGHGPRGDKLLSVHSTAPDNFGRSKEHGGALNERGLVGGCHRAAPAGFSR